MNSTLKRSRRPTGALPMVCATLALVAILAGGLRSGEDRAAAPKLQPDLAHVPGDALAFCSVRLGELWGHSGLRPVIDDFAKEKPAAVKQLEQLIGVEPAEIERITFFVRDIGPAMAFSTVAKTVKPYDRKKVLATLGKTAREIKRKDRTYYTGGDSQRAVYLIDERTFALGPTADVEAALDTGMAATGGPLAEALRVAAGGHSLVAGFAPTKINEVVGDQVPAGMEMVRPLLLARVASLALDAGVKLKADVRMTFSGDAEAKEGARALKSGLETLGSGLKPALLGMYGPEGSDLLTRLTNTLKGAKVEVRSKEIHAELTPEASVKEVGDALLEGTTKARTAARRGQAINKLKQIALAMHNYHSTYGSFPAAAVYDKDGKPLLSWRVLLLPFLEEGALYKEFHLDEPWDSEHNKKLTARMPAVFQSNAGDARDGETYFQGFNGKGAFFEDKKGIKITDIPDGTSNTCMVIEAGRGVSWTKPEDIPFDPVKPLPKLGFRPDGFCAAYCDGSVRFIRRATKEKTMKAIITRNGGEVIENDP